MDKNPGGRIILEVLAAIIIWLIITRGDELYMRGKIFLSRLEYIFSG